MYVLIAIVRLRMVHPISEQSEISKQRIVREHFLKVLCYLHCGLPIYTLSFRYSEFKCHPIFFPHNSLFNSLAILSICFIFSFIFNLINTFNLLLWMPCTSKHGVQPSDSSFDTFFGDAYVTHPHPIT